MRISVLIISAASLVALGGLAQADDHLFQAFTKGLGDRAFDLPDSPGRGSPFTSFGDEKGVPSADPEVTASENGAHDLPAAADPPCPGCSRD